MSFRRSLFLTAMYATTLCASAQAQEKWYLKDESVACLSEELYSTQLKYVTQGVNELIKGCIITTKEYQVILVESHVFSPSKVILVENKLTMWTDFNSLTSK